MNVSNRCNITKVMKNKEEKWEVKRIFILITHEVTELRLGFILGIKSTK